jgi:PAS domain S-box-containing protein
MQQKTPLPHRFIVEQAPMAIIFADAKGDILLWNAAAERVFGYTATEALGKNLDLIIPEDLRPAHWRGYHQAMAEARTKKTNQVLTTRSMHKDGRKIYVNLSFAVVVDDQGSPLGALACGWDCTQQYLEQKALRRKLAE